MAARGDWQALTCPDQLWKNWTLYCFCFIFGFCYTISSAFQKWVLPLKNGDDSLLPQGRIWWCRKGDGTCPSSHSRVVEWLGPEPSTLGSTGSWCGYWIGSHRRKGKPFGMKVLSTQVLLPFQPQDRLSNVAVVGLFYNGSNEGEALWSKKTNE